MVQKVNKMNDDIVTIFQWKLVSFVSKYNQQQNVFFIDLNNQIGHFYYNGNCWSYESLTGFVEGAAPKAGSPLTGFVSEYNQQQHVSFIDANNHIKQLVYCGNKWGCEDLTVAANAPTPQASGPLTSFASEYNKQQHIIFIDANNHIGQIVYDGTKLMYEDLTVAANAPTPQASSPLTSFASEYNKQQHIIFIDANNHIGQIVYGGTKLMYEDLTVGADAPTPQVGSPLTSFMSEYNQQQHVIFIDANNHIGQIVYDGTKLTYEDLTAGAKGVTPQAGSALIGFASESNQQQYVFFVDANNYIGEIFYNGATLSYQDLKLLTYEGRVLTGFADGYQPHVFFIDPNNIISHISYGLHCEELKK
ncbi:hypothetical protein [Sporomusa sp. GT1]|uniref:hypothetical protein n=1 Tax=Sporomusa sp. GT1 TaxID=1534747 RepID=UPI0016691C61|nr:hypothetical protein [Sporomusa sp. GT1]